jgi:hypothetical protein
MKDKLDQELERTKSINNDLLSSPKKPQQAIDKFKDLLIEKFQHLKSEIIERGGVLNLDRVRLFEIFAKISDHYYPAKVKYYDSENNIGK